MKPSRCAALFALLLLVACGGGSSNAPNPPGAPQPVISSPPLTSASEDIAPSAAATTAPLPNIGGVYGGQVILPSGSGRATLTFSLTAPSGITALTESTPTPLLAYITITAQSAFTLSASPGLNLTVPNSYLPIVMWLNYYSNAGWPTRQLGWPSVEPGFSVMCFAVQGKGISLEQGQSFYLGINGDDVIPTPTITSTPPPCPQSAT